MEKTITSIYNGQTFTVEVVSEDDLPRSCFRVASLMDDKDFKEYTVYEDSVAGMFYATVEEDE